MSATAEIGADQAPGQSHPTSFAPAPIIRFFGWATLTVMAAFIVNNVLTFWAGWPGIAPLLGGEVSLLSLVQLAIYAVALFAALRVMTRRNGAPLRRDAEIVSDANIFLVRAAFWVVILVGIVDFAIAFGKVENLIAPLLGDEMSRELGKSAFRGFYVHGTLVFVGILMATITRGISFIWLSAFVVLAELTIVLSRFVFSYEQAFQADLVRFWYAALFLFASAYTLFEDGHVRVDVAYAGFSRRGKAIVNAWGSILLGMSLCWTILLLGMWSKTSIINSPILVYEVTQSSSGLYVKYFMAAFLGVFAVTMMMQFVSSFFEAFADRRNEPGAREKAEIMH